MYLHLLCLPPHSTTFYLFYLFHFTAYADFLPEKKKQQFYIIIKTTLNNTP